MDFRNSDVYARFDKWTVAGVADFTNVPEGMVTFVLTACFRICSGQLTAF